MFTVNNSIDNIDNISIYKNNMNNSSSYDLFNNKFFLEILLIIPIFLIIIFIIYFSDKQNRYWCRKKNKIKPIIIT